MKVDINFFYYVLVAALITGIIRYKAIEPSVLRLLVPFLALSIVVEAIGLLMSDLKIRNHWVFNFFTCFEFLFYSYIYLRVLEDGKWVRIIRYSMIGYPILFLVNIFFVEGFNRFHTITYRIGSVMIVTWCYIYLRQVMRSPSYQSVFRNPIFWISTGLLFFYTGFFFYMSAAYILLYTKLEVDKYVWAAISGTLNTLLYGCFLISFLCKESRTNK